MNKSLVALFAALVAVATMFASTAEAGFKIRLGFGGPLPSFTAHGNGGHAKRHYYRKRYIARRAAKKVVVAKKSKPSAVKVAKKEVSKPQVVATAPAEVVEEPEVTADSENSSITTAALDPAAAGTEAASVEVKADATTEKAAVEPKRTSKLDCKKFFPSVGMTLTVPCE